MKHAHTISALPNIPHTEKGVIRDCAKRERNADTVGQLSYVPKHGQWLGRQVRVSRRRRRRRRRRPSIFRVRMGAQSARSGMFLPGHLPLSSSPHSFYTISFSVLLVSFLD